MTVGASDVDIFVGVNGPAAHAGAMGLSIENVGFGLALMKPVDTQDTSNYYGLTATASAVSLVGISGFTLSVNNITVEVNGGTDMDAQKSERVVDFTKGDLDGDNDADGKTTVKACRVQGAGGVGG